MKWSLRYLCTLGRSQSHRRSVVYLVVLLSLLNSRPVLAEESEGAERILRTLGTSVIFDSNPNNNFGIYAVGGTDLKRRVVYDTTAHEIMPDPSPSGEWLAFAKGDSPRREQHFDIWVVRFDGTGARKVAHDGTSPTWKDDDTIVFARNERTVMTVDLHTGIEKLLYTADHTAFHKSTIHHPTLSPNGKQLALTVRSHRKYKSYVVSLEDGAIIPVGKGCQPTWSRDGKSVYWVFDRNAKHATAIGNRNLLDRSQSVVVDQDVPRGIDYFPSLSADGKYLLYASGMKRRDYILGDYQLHVRELASGISHRLTNDELNNRYPKFIRERSEYPPKAK